VGQRHTPGKLPLPKEYEVQRDYEVPGEFSLETPSGTYLDLIDPDPSTIVLEDIAHSLSQICRFGGHTSRPYSVAEHVVRVSWKMGETGYTASTCMAGLHHDDAEAYLGDIPTPLKKLFGYSYRSLTRSIDDAIQQAVGAPLIDDAGTKLTLGTVEDFASEPVRQADRWALCCEAHELMPSKGAGWADEHSWGVVDPNADDYGWCPEAAESWYLKRHNSLYEQLT
jgi:hypothetical protein